MFADFYARTYPASKRLAYLLTGSLAAADDVTQDAYAAVYPRFAGLERPDRYLRTVVVNGCRRMWRRRRFERDHLAQLASDHVELPPQTAELLSGVRRLAHRQQVVLVLRYWARLTEAEIAETLGCPTGTVKTLHHRAIARLREEFS